MKIELKAYNMRPSDIVAVLDMHYLDFGADLLQSSPVNLSMLERGELFDYLKCIVGQDEAITMLKAAGIGDYLILDLMECYKLYEDMMER